MTPREDAVARFECMVCGGGTTPCALCGDAGVMRKRSRPGGGGSCARCVVADERMKKINIGGYVSVPTIGALTKSLARAFTKRRPVAPTASPRKRRRDRGRRNRATMERARRETRRRGRTGEFYLRRSRSRERVPRQGVPRGTHSSVFIARHALRPANARVWACVWA